MKGMELRKRLAVALAAGLMAAAVAAPGAAQTITGFTADQVVIGAKGKVEQERKLSVAGDRIRIERVMPADAKVTYIFRKDIKRSVTINPAKKLYFEEPFDEKALAAVLGLPSGTTAERSAGEETLSGFACARKELDMEIDFKKGKKTVTSTVWLSDRLDIPLRIKSHEGLVTELRQIKEGAPDPALFETPKDFKKAASLKEVLPGDPFLDDDD